MMLIFSTLSKCLSFFFLLVITAVMPILNINFIAHCTVYNSILNLMKYIFLYVYCYSVSFKEFTMILLWISFPFVILVLELDNKKSYPDNMMDNNKSNELYLIDRYSTKVELNYIEFTVEDKLISVWIGNYRII